MLEVIRFVLCVTDGVLASETVVDHCFRLWLSWRRSCESSVMVNVAAVSHTHTHTHTHTQYTHRGASIKVFLKTECQYYA